ncbi:MAG TPA: hypothetical protein VFY12_12940 [Arenimonas sp.]|nr:hypothetical protein [Arenimonas sp.]
MKIAQVGMASPFRWLQRALDVGRRHPQALFGGFAIFLVIALLPTLLQLGLQLGLGLGPEALLAVNGLTLLLSVFLLPPLFGGAFRLLHACESGQAPSALDVLAPYREPQTALRLVLTALLIVLLYALAFGLLMLLPGGGFFADVMRIAATTPPGAQPDVSGLVAPPSLLLWLLAAVFIAIVLGNAYMLAFAQAALGGRGPLLAVSEGLWASLKNLLPFIAVFIAVVLGGFVLALLLVLVAAAVLGVLGMISPVLAALVGVPLYFGLLLLIYVVMFGYYYHAWREIFGAVPPPLDDAIAA